MAEGTGTVSDDDESASSDDDIKISLKDKAAAGLPIRIRNMKTIVGAGVVTGSVKVKPWA